VESGLAPSVRVARDLRTGSASLARLLRERADRAVRERGRFAWVLAGGKTPQALYEHLAGEARPRFPWASTDVFFGDERCVGPSAPESNFGAAWTAMLSHVPVNRSRVHRMRGELRPVAEAARRYDRRVGVGGASRRGAPRFDVVLLGLGPDGHTAFLFPGSGAVRESRRSVVAVPKAGQSPYVPRITLTVPALASSREVWFLVAGAEKAEAVAKVFAALPRGDPRLPASLVRSAGTVTWFLDEACAAALPSSVARTRLP
jgi:6-phosphogluconolactonase